MQWLYAARKKFNLVILDYMVTSNHVHLLVYDQAGKETIPKSIQLLAGRIGQEYNLRKKRVGAFWQDRYHATAVETGEHLRKCIVYIDLNMVRTGTIDHPSQWTWCGYNEIQNPKRKNRLINYEKLKELTEFDSYEMFKNAHKSWVEESLLSNKNKRKNHWSKSIAVGSETFTKKVFAQLESKIKGRTISKMEEGFQIREAIEPYNAFFGPEKGDIGPKNSVFWE